MLSMAMNAMSAEASAFLALLVMMLTLMVSSSLLVTLTAASETLPSTFSENSSSPVACASLLLLKTMTDEQKEVFEKFHDCWSEYASLGECAIFCYAFKLGMRIAIETLTK